MTPQDKKAFNIVKKLFRTDSGQPFEMTAGQIQLFRAIYEKQYQRNQFECYTQYGKSDVVSMAILLRGATFPEKWIILGGTKDKARIIMNKLIKHLFENDYTLGKFQVPKDDSLEMIKRYRSKDHISFKIDNTGNMGEVLILSADATKKGQDAGDILIGHGGQNLVEDDAALIPDPIHGKAMRMLGGHKDNFLLKITNTFGRNHAFKSSNDPDYHKILINCQQGIEEGRVTPEYIDEMRGLLDPIMFGILYDCIYPPADMVDEQGWMPILTEEDIEQAQNRKVDAKGPKLFGGDIAEGTNYNAFVIRQDNIARVKEKTLEKELMKTANHIVELLAEESILDFNCFIDAVGVGAGVFSRCKEMGFNINGIKSGEKPTIKTIVDKTMDPIEFANLRAEMTWKARSWIKEGGALEPNRDWNQLSKLRYKIDAEKKVKIMSKEEMRARGLIQASESPDVADAFVLTFGPAIKIIDYPAPTPPALPYYPELGL